MQYSIEQFKSNQTFLITGATKGIGLATCQYLAKQGYQIIGIARNKSGEFPGELFLADLSDAEATEAIFHEIKQKHKINGIVNNVGFAVPSSIDQITLENFHKIFDFNLRPSIQAIQAFKNTTIEKSFGRIVNISSRALLGRADIGLFSAAKAALVAFTRSWALELATTGITVNAIAPGMTETEQLRLHRPIGSQAEKQSLDAIPMHRFG